MIGVFGSLNKRWIQPVEKLFGKGLRIIGDLHLFGMDSDWPKETPDEQSGEIFIHTDGVSCDCITCMSEDNNPVLREIGDLWHEREQNAESNAEVLQRIVSTLAWRGSVWCSIDHESEPAEQCLYLVSDKIGSCPIYYHAVDRSIFWSSSLADLTQLVRSIQGRITLSDGLNGFLKFLYLPSPETLIKEIRKLPAAFILTFSSGALEIQRYWQPDLNSFQPDWKESTDRLRTLLPQVIDAPIYSGSEPAALLLSGGLDSSLLAALFKEKGIAFETYAVGFSGENDEHEDAGKVAAYYDVRHHSIELRPENVEDLLLDTVRLQGFPSGNPSAIATFAAASSAQSTSRYLISGMGSDELFCGHRKHIAARYWPMTKKLLTWSRQMTYRRCHKNNLFFGRPSALNSYEDFYSFFNREEINALLAEGSLTGRDPAPHDWPSSGFEQNIFLTDVYGWLLGCLLPQATAVASGRAMHFQTPLCGDKLLETAAAIPFAHKVKGSNGIWILRQAAAGFLPPFVLKKRRSGFTLPMANWLRGPLRELLNKYLNKEVIRHRGLFKPEAVQRMIHTHLSTRADLSLQLWAMISLEIWLQMFFDGES